MNEQTNTKPTSVGLRYGFITGFLLIIFSLVLYLADLSENRALTLSGWLIVVAGLVLAMKAFRQENNGFMEYGQGLGIGTIVGALAGVLAGIFGAIYTSYIDPSIVQKALDKQVMQMEDQGMSQAQIDKAIEYGNMFSGPVAIVIFSIVLYAIGAFILSLIIAAIMKRSRPEFE